MGGGKKTKNYDILDLTKVILCLMVVAIHTELFPLALYPWLRLAVPLFFIISAFLLFGKIRTLSTKKEQDAAVKHYVLRIGKLYLFWFVVLLPITIYVRRDWFSNGILEGLVNVVVQPLFGSTFPASWYLMASVIGTLVVYKLSNRLSNKTMLVLFLIAYSVCCYFSSYAYVVQGFGIEAATSLRFSPKYSFLSGLIFIWLGKMIAEKKITIEKSYNRLLILLFCILLFLEWLMIYNFTGRLNNDCYIMLIPTAMLIFNYLKDIKITVRNSKTFRQFSNFTYPLHASVALLIGAVLESYMIVDASGGLMNFVLTVSVCLIAFWAVKKLENKIPILKYSY